MPKGRLPRVARIRSRSQIDLNPLRVQRYTGKWHVVFPTNQTAHSSGIGFQNLQCAAIPFSPNEPLPAGWFQLTVTMKQLPIRSEVQQCAVERTAAYLAFTLDDSNHRIDAGLAAGRCQGLGDFAWDFNCFFIESLPLVASFRTALTNN